MVNNGAFTEERRTLDGPFGRSLHDPDPDQFRRLLHRRDGAGWRLRSTGETALLQAPQDILQEAPRFPSRFFVEWHGGLRLPSDHRAAFWDRSFSDQATLGLCIQP